jgi:excisionase family DNA binding protein
VVDDPLLTVEEVAQLFRVSEVTIRRWIEAKKIKHVVRVTKRSGYRIPKSEVERLIREHQRPD